ncbi:MAG: 3-isopropylmalate dehydratase large subunit [Thaumarchaeota archaeon]|jgi:3-isopropylmalate/(R)-2-methylmalate dehydratase large subunit|nr:3-isopropylmalate dehydratase large subunit [Nitrososphaerota archaeon]
MTGLTAVQKVLSRKTGRPRVEPGEIVEAKVDFLMLHEVTGPLAVEEFEKISGKVWDPSRVIVVFDHDVPPSTIDLANQMRRMRSFVKKHGVNNFFEIGRGGIAHQVLFEEGFDMPGFLIVGADSHTCTAGATGAVGIGVGSTDAAVVLATGEIWLRVPETLLVEVKGRLRKGVFAKDVALSIVGRIGSNGATYKALEYSGETVSMMSLSERLTLANLSVETGAKTGIVQTDSKSIEYAENSGRRSELLDVRSDPDACLEKIEIDVSNLEPVVSLPHSVDNVKPVAEVEGLEIDQAFLGSCTNGRLDDLLVAFKILKGRRVAPSVRLVVSPASVKVYAEALRAGVVEEIVRAGGIVTSPTCGPCLGMSRGVLAEGEVAVSSSNRNFIGRMGDKRSKVFLASPATVVASAVEGRIADPRRFLP